MHKNNSSEKFCMQCDYENLLSYILSIYYIQCICGIIVEQEGSRTVDLINKKS